MFSRRLNNLTTTLGSLWLLALSSRVDTVHCVRRTGDTLRFLSKWRKPTGRSTARTGGARYHCRQCRSSPRTIVPSADSYDAMEERRWQSLMDYCAGNWTGSIGWYNVVITVDNVTHHNGTDDDTDDQRPQECQDRARALASAHRKNGRVILPSLVPRADNGVRNMRLSFHPTPTSEAANWTVYHAHGQGIKEEVVLERRHSVSPRTENDTTAADSGSKLLPVQTFYAFSGGILGRTGSNLSQRVPVIEHGFWQNGIRKTVVLVYEKDSRYLQKICFVQQVKTAEGAADFDVSASNASHLDVLPKEPTMTVEEFDRSFGKLELQWAEAFQFPIPSIQSRNENADKRLDGIRTCWDPCQESFAHQNRADSCRHDNDATMPMLSIVLPNHVALTCPWQFPKEGTFCICMKIELDSDDEACQTSLSDTSNSKKMHVIDLHYVDVKIVC